MTVRRRPCRRRRLGRQSLITGLGLGLVAAAAGCGGPSQDPASDPGLSTSATDLGRAIRLDLRFDDPLTDAATVRRITSAGSGSYDITVVTSGGGGLVTQPGRNGGVDRALRFPPFAPVIAGPRAVIRVSATGPTDDLNPAAGDFTFGADIRLASPSQSPTGDDDGNNVVQRGLYADPIQYKLEVDEGLATCRVKGSAGDVLVTSKTPIEPRTWYRLRCLRRADSVTLTVVRWPANGSTTTSQDRRAGATGDLTPPDPGVPLTVGGKLSSDGASIEAQSDQFNGLIDNVVLEIG